jgi:hypothetical protein
MLSAKFELVIPTIEKMKKYALEGRAIEIGIYKAYSVIT